MSGNKLVLFDCDGTLIDSQGSIVASLTEVWKESGFTPPDPSEIRKIIGLSVKEGIAHLLPEEDLETYDKVEKRCREAFIKNRSRTTDFLFPGIKELLHDLHQTGFVLGIATGMSRHGVDHMLQLHGFENLFTTIQTSDQRRSKPDPEMAHQALLETETEAHQAIMIGDTIFDMQMAKAAGMKAIGVSWGYHDRSALHEEGALHVVDDTKELSIKIVDTVARQKFFR